MHIERVKLPIRVCVGCGKSFPQLNPLQMRCERDCGRNRKGEPRTLAQKQTRNASRTQARVEAKPHFIAVDGEGVTDPDTNEHRYVLLSVGENSLHRDGAHLTFEEIMSFLWEQFQEHPDAVYVGYYLGYDFTQWLRSLPEDRARILYSPERRARTKSGGNTTPFPAEFREWQFDMLGNKRFKLRKEGASEWMYICDVGGFYQQAFATAMLDWQDREGKPIAMVHCDERETIEKGKARRATAKFDREMIRYNVAENRVLARMMDVLAEGFVEMGVQLKRDQWYGPGQVAQKWLDQHSTHSAKVIQAKAESEPVFRDVLDAARKSFYGGWFEAFAHGHVKGEAWEYDIVSAYPYIQSGLPCLLHGEWSHAEGREALRGEWCLARCDVEGSNPYIGTMLHRDQSGKINRPDYTSGWYWKHELDAAQRAGLIDTITCHEAFTYTPCKCLPPFRKMAESFELRKQRGKKTPMGRSLKLKNNSCYGKQAQSIGRPKHANPIVASLITAGTRTMILEAIATHPRGAAGVLKIATDGIYFDTRHPALNIAPDELGAWEETRKENLTIFLPGVYWDDVSRASRLKQAAKLKSRGVSAADLMERLDALDAEFDRMISDGDPWRMFEGDVSAEWWAKMTLPIRFSMVSPKQALQRNKWDLAGTITPAATRALDANPRHKRELVSLPTADKPYIHTFRPRNYTRAESTPYNRRFGIELETQNEEDYVLTPEGDAISEAYTIIKGK